MDEPCLDKWLSTLHPDDTLDVVVTKLLRSRMDAVRYFLPLAAREAEKDVEYVHQLRVWSRRSMAVLRLYRPLLSKKQSKWFQQRLRRIREAAGSARDYDVLLQRHQDDVGGTHTVQFLERLERQRRDAQKPIRIVYRDLKKGKQLKRKTKRILESLSRGRRQKLAKRQFADWARQPLQRLVARFQDAAPADTTDLLALHRFRIRGKQLRYGIELLAPAYPAELKERVYPELQQLQEQLGELNDRAVAVRRLVQGMKSAQDSAEHEYLAGLARQEQRHRDRCVEEFEAWWSGGQWQRFLELTTPIITSRPRR